MDLLPAVETLLEWNQQCPITSIDLSMSKVGSNGALLIGKLLQHNYPIRSLNLSGNTTSLVTRVVTSLCLGNRIGPRGAQAIAAGLEVNVTLQKLDLSNNKFFYKGAILMQKAVSLHPSLKRLSLRNNGVR